MNEYLKNVTRRFAVYIYEKWTDFFCISHYETIFSFVILFNETFTLFGINDLENRYYC